MKKVSRFLRFLAIIFFTFLAIVVCFIFNKALDQKIEEQHTHAIEALGDYNTNEK